MFKLVPNPTFKAEVVIPVAGQPEGDKVTFVFKHMGKKAFLKFYEGLAGAEPRTDVEVLSELLAGWEGVEGEFNAENLEALLDNYPAAALAVMEKYRTELFEARVKN